MNPYDDLKVALATGELSRFDPREGMEEYPWQQHPNDDSANELFADYFLNMTPLLGRGLHLAAVAGLQT